MRASARVGELTTFISGSSQDRRLLAEEHGRTLALASHSSAFAGGLN
jgi:hypothetical protein